MTEVLSFCNQYPQPAWVAIVWYHPNCDNGLGDWEKAGWWLINTNTCANVLDLDLDETNRYYYFYAQASDGATWSGPYDVDIPLYGFDRCIGLGDTTERVFGFREIDIGDNDDFTMNLIS